MAAADILAIPEAAAISLMEDGRGGQTYDVGGSAMISGPGNAALWSKLKKKEIKSHRPRLQRLGERMRERMPSWSTFDLRMMLEESFDRGFASTETEVALLTRLLGHAPRNNRSICCKTAKAWKA